MKNILLSTAAMLSLTSFATAQDLPQAASPWFQAGQATIAARLAAQPITGRAKNVILFTADGNGVGSNYAVRLFSGQLAGGLGDDYVQPQETFPNVALVKTYSSNGQTPDSAPTAAAMNTGIKTKNGMINVLDTVNVGDCAAGATAGVKTFAEMASEMGKSVGVISTARITHATPAAVYARTVNRDWEDNSLLPEGCTQKDIADQLIDQMKAGVIDIALGGGRQHFLPDRPSRISKDKEGKRTDNRNLVEEAKAAGALGRVRLGRFRRPDHGQQRPRPGPVRSQPHEIRTGPFRRTVAGRNDRSHHQGPVGQRKRLFPQHRRLAVSTMPTTPATCTACLWTAKPLPTPCAKAMEMTNPEDTLIIVTADHEHAICLQRLLRPRVQAITGLCMVDNENGVEHTGSAEPGRRWQALHRCGLSERGRFGSGRTGADTGAAVYAQAYAPPRRPDRRTGHRPRLPAAGADPDGLRNPFG